jgi:hypothetical protein
MTLRAWSIGIVLSAGCAGPSQRLPAATSNYQVDNTLVFELPDSGGYIVNGVPLDTAAIREQITALFSQRAPGQRAVFVWNNPTRAWRDVAPLQRYAQQAGGQAFDAELSGWPRQVPPSQQ